MKSHTNKNTLCWTHSIRAVAVSLTIASLSTGHTGWYLQHQHTNVRCVHAKHKFVKLTQSSPKQCCIFSLSIESSQVYLILAFLAEC